MVENKVAAKMEYLPDECWELIFKKLGGPNHNNNKNDHHLDAISLVCHRFLSISSPLIHSLTISDPKILLRSNNFTKLSRRFPRIKRIRIEEFLEDLDALLVDIAQSGLNIEELHLSDHSKLPVKRLQEMCSNMKGLKTLKCKNCNLRDNGLTVIANSLPKLQELKLCSRADITDQGVEELASKLKELRKIKLFVSGRPGRVTANGIGNALRHCSNLSSLSLGYYEVDFLISSSATFAFENSIFYTRALCALEFYFSVISDALVASIVNANLPLKKLKFHLCKNIGVSGLSILLRKYQSISEFQFKWRTCLNDQDMDHLSKYLLHVTHINLSGCKELTNSTFFLLARSCPLLVDINMCTTGLGKEGDLRVDLKKHGQIQFLDLSGSEYLNDESLKRIGYVCPNLQMLSLCGHPLITEEGISYILKSCPGIRHFAFTESRLKMILGTESECSKLNIEELIVSDMINDKGMAMIGMRCPCLLKLNIMWCYQLTAEGVMEVVKKCPTLMELDLRYCCNVDFDVLSSMLLTRPSLRKVFSPDESFSTEERRNSFMRHGCRLY